MSAQQFRKRPIVIEAEQIRLNLIFSPEYGYTAANPFNALVMRRPRWWKSPVPMIKTLEGWLTVSPGDWIIKGVQGEFYPCKPDIFEQTYERVGA
jgi:hypothetical protein